MHRKDKLNMMFEAIDDEGKDVVLDILTGEYERVRASRRARLRLVSCTHPAPNVPHQPLNPTSISRAR